MDDFLDHLLSSASWISVNDSSRSSWDGTTMSNAISLLADSSQPFGGEFPSFTVMGNPIDEALEHHGDDGTSSALIDRNLKQENERGLRSVTRLSQQTLHRQNSVPTMMHNDLYDNKFSPHVVIDRAESFDSAFSGKALAISSSIESNDSEHSAFPQSYGEANSITSVPAFWPSSYSSISSNFPQGKLQDFGFQGIKNNTDIAGKTCLENGKVHLGAMPTASTHLQNPNEQHGFNYASFSSGQPKLLSTSALQYQKMQNVSCPPIPPRSLIGLKNTNTGHLTISSSGVQSQAATPNSSSGTGAGKPRVRARRGQATDPHSVAERLRREKIAERLKNLQELVPNSNKADKATMLDEIIDYVKFLQLQVKVLSMSRLGATGAVVPLLTDNQNHTEASCSLLLSAAFGEDASYFSDSEESLAFEQEVVRLMETNITNAMRCLQHKGLCLMPIALASAMSRQKGDSMGIPFVERKTSEEENSSCNASSFKQHEEANKTIDDSKEMLI